MVNLVLTDSERTELLAQGNAAFIEVLGRLYAAESRRHERGKRRGSLEVEDKYLTLLDKHRIRATLDEIADLYLNDQKKMVLDFSESRELVALQQPSALRPLEYTGVRWSLFRSPNRTVAKDQDFCYLEVMKPYTSHSGRRGWAKCSHSIDHRICPDLSSTISVNRGRLHYCGVFFQETDDPSVLDGIFYYSVDKTQIPALLAPVVMKSRGRNNAELLNHYVKLARLRSGGNAAGSSSKTQAASDSLARQLQAERRCGACSNRLPAWTPRAKCVFCRAYMCKKCSKIVRRNYRVRDIGRNHVCFSCAEQHGARLARPIADNYLTDDAASSVADESEAPSVQSPISTDDEDSALLDSLMSSDHDNEQSPTRPRKHSAAVQYVLGEVPVSSPTKVTVPRSRVSRSGAPPPPRKTHSAPRMVAASELEVDRSIPSSKVLLRRRSRASSTEASRVPPSPVPASPMRPEMRRRPTSSDRIAAAIAGNASLGSPRGLDLEEVNLRHRSHTTDAVPMARASHEEAPQRQRAATTSPFSRENPVDLSYLSGFK